MFYGICESASQIITIKDYGILEQGHATSIISLLIKNPGMILVEKECLMLRWQGTMRWNNFHELCQVL